MEKIYNITFDGKPVSIRVENEKLYEGQTDDFGTVYWHKSKITVGDLLNELSDNKGNFNLQYLPLYEPDSTQIDCALFDEVNGYIWMIFCSSPEYVYRYDNVSVRVWSQFISARSAGSYHYHYIKNNPLHPYTRFDIDNFIIPQRQ